MTAIARRGLCLVLSAPSGAGKSAITERLIAGSANLHRSISVTTRRPRPKEVDGVHYHFITEAEFTRMEQDGELLEWARVLSGTHGYGSPRAPIEAALAAGADMIFDIDWQGFRQMRDRLPGDVLGVFILPPGLRELEQRLHGRAGDSAQEIARRMETARDEMSHWNEFDHVVINDNLDQAVAEVIAILTAARLRTDRRIGLADFVAAMAGDP